VNKEEQWIQTFTGKKFYPFSPKVEDICIEDIAHALSLICRFNGHCREFYSVAQHSCLVSGLCGAKRKNASKYHQDLAKLGLLHDAAEAYLGDIARPIKSREDDDRERWLFHKIKQVFGLDEYAPKLDEEIARHDASTLACEKAILIPHYLEWPGVTNVDPKFITIVPWAPEEAEAKFLIRFDFLFGEKGNQDAR